MNRIGIVLSVLLAGLASGQTSQVAGRIIDQTGGVVFGAHITVTSTGQGVRREVESNQDGLYVVPLLQPGQYTVEVARTGFKPVSRSGVAVETGAATTVDVELEVGTASEAVTVEEGAGPLVQQASSAVAAVIRSSAIASLPLIDRRSSQLARLGGFVVQNGTSSNFAIAGGRGGNAMWLLDGGNAQNLPNIGTPTLVFDPPVESMQEFSVSVSNYAAELGRTGGGVIQMTTKSGTNNIHGAAYEYFRNDKLNARTFFAPVRPPLRYNLFGAAVGGPIKKDRTFFFFNFEGLRRTDATSRVLNLPTPAEVTGDFSASAGIVKDPVTGTPFPGNRIPASRLDPIGAQIASFYPAPNVAGQGSGNANFSANQTVVTYNNTYVSRFDHTFSERDRGFIRLLGQRSITDNKAVFPVAAADLNASKASAGYLNGALSWFHNFTPTLINEFRYSYDRRASITRSSSAGSGLNGRIGLGGVNPNFFTTATVAGYTQLGASGDQERIQVPTQASIFIEHLTLVRGKHQYKAGFEFRYSRNDDVYNGRAGGQFDFTNSATGNSLAALLLGWTNQGQINAVYPLGTRSDNVGLFFQDDWRVTPRLTLDLGLRWDIDQPRWAQDNQQNQFDRYKINPVSGTPGVITFSGRDGVSKYAHNFDWNNIGPRFGFAWRGPGSIVVRGGSGLIYVGLYDMAAPILATLGFSQQGQFVSPDGGITPAFLLRNGLPPVARPTESDLTAAFGAVPLGARPTTSVQFFETGERRTGYLIQNNLNIQKELRGGYLVEIGYLNTIGHKLPATPQSGRGINQVPAALLGPGNAQALRPFPQFTDVRVLAAPIGNSVYHGLNIKVEKRMAAGLSLQGNYTFSRFIDDVSSRSEVGAYGDVAGFVNYYDRRNDRGLSGNNIGHRFIVNTIYELPFGPGKRFLRRASAARYLLGGWQIAYIGEFRSGAPYGVIEAVNRTNSFSDGQRPNVVGNPVLSSDRSTAAKLAQWFNTAAFAQPALYTFGNAGRTAGYGPGAISMDTSLIKDFPVQFIEGHKLELRADALNFINRANFGNPAVARGNASFGRITTLAPGNQARIIQIGLTYRF
jgi:hypothetical protein